MPVFVDEITGFGLLPRAKLDDLRVIAIRDKADILTVRLVGVDKIGLARELARLGFAELSQREKSPGKQLLRHVVEHVALVLRLVIRLAQLI